MSGPEAQGVVVTQEDRQAAFDLLAVGLETLTYPDLFQAFARHRQSALLAREPGGAEADAELEPGELRACPFCGGEAARHEIGQEEPSNVGGHVIACKQCGASSHVEFGRAENLTSAWNSRALPASAAPVVGENVERVKIVRWIDQAIARADKHGNTEGIWLHAQQWRTFRAALSAMIEAAAPTTSEGVR